MHPTLEYPGDVDFVVHVGAGRCRELGSYLASDALQILLIEPDPELAEDLRVRTEGDSRVTVFEQAVSDRSGDAVLRLFNHSDYNSLRAPTGLLELFPGLRAVGEVVVQVEAASDLLHRLPIEQDARNMLVIDAPGEEEPILCDLIDSGGLRFFERISLHCGVEPLFAGAAASDEILRILADAGYSIAGSANHAEPFLIALDLIFDRIKFDYRFLTVRASELEEMLAESKAAHEADLRRAEDQSARLKAELEDKIDQASRLESELAKSRADREQLSREKEQLSRQKDQHDSELQEAREALSVAVRLLHLRESDLRELRQRFSAIRDREREQRDLLVEFLHRLEEAEGFLRRLDVEAIGTSQVAEQIKALDIGGRS